MEVSVAMPNIAESQKWILAPGPESSRRMPWRKIHLDFHNSKHVERIADQFDALEFVEILRSARVDAVVVFAKDMHGYCYYPSEVGPVHPGLSRDLLGEQVRACRDAGIEVYAYYCTLWDHHLAEEHPNWLSRRRDGRTHLPEPGQAPDWTALCASHHDLVDLIQKHVTEVLGNYDVDGMWFDMPVPRDGECFCPNCITGMSDPFDVDEQRQRQHDLHVSFLNSLYETCQDVKPGCQVDFNNQPAFGLERRFPWMSSIDIEALPTAQWGYDFFPTVSRYVRTFPRTYYGMTGRFHKGWGDFGGLKTAEQMSSECFGIISTGAKCDIGDQMHPSGRLDSAVYRNIGQAYREIEKLEHYLEGGQSVAEIAIVISGKPLDSVATDSVLGLSKALCELNYQFDVLEPHQSWRDYPLSIHPHAEVLPHVGLAMPGPAFHEIGAVLSEFDPTFAVIPEDFEYAIYGKAYSWQATGQAIAHLGEPAFQRSAAQYTSHAQGPIHSVSPNVVAEIRGTLGLLGFDLGKLYAETGFPFYRQLLGQFLAKLLPGPLVQVEGSDSIQATVVRHSERQEWLVHVFDSAVGRPSTGHPPLYEMSAPRSNVNLKFNLPNVGKALAVRVNRDMAIENNLLVLPILDRYELLVIPEETNAR